MGSLRVFSTISGPVHAVSVYRRTRLRYTALMPDFVVLTVDDDVTQLALVDAVIGSDTEHSIEHLQAETLSAGREMLLDRRVDLVITDYLLPDGTGLELLDHAKRVDPLISVIVITGNESIEHSVSAMKRGADDYLVKPINGRALGRTIGRMIEAQSAEPQGALPTTEHGAVRPVGLVYQSTEMAEAVSIALRGARSTASVLIRGESGTGKELFAKLIHENSPRRGRPFVAVNLAALPESVIESELFGHRKGAFTGASQDREGRFQAADGGTLFLDELGDVPLSVQVKLLRAVQFKQVEPVGGDRSLDVDVRIIAATNRDLETMISRREFRDDLYYRLNVLAVRVPPLRARRIDIPLLAQHILKRVCPDRGEGACRISSSAMHRLMRYDYPGNVRELENVIERAALLAANGLIGESALPEQLLLGPTAPEEAPSIRIAKSLDERLAEVEREIITEALGASAGNQSLAAQRLGIGERRLRSRMERLSISNTFRDRGV